MKWIIGALGAALLMACASTTPSRSADRRAAHVWIAENPDKMPRTYDEIIRFPHAYRVEIYDHLQPYEQSALWHEQIARYRAKHAITPEQQAIFERALKEVSPEAFAKPPPVDGNALIRDAAKAFGRRLAWALFGQIGPEDADPAEAFGPPASLH